MLKMTLVDAVFSILSLLYFWPSNLYIIKYIIIHNYTKSARDRLFGVGEKIYNVVYVFIEVLFLEAIGHYRWGLRNNGYRRNYCG